MSTFNECISFEFNPYSYEEERYNYKSQLKEIVAKKYVEKDSNSSIERDICSADFYQDEENNWVFRYKAVPGTAVTSASYSFRYALIISPINILNI